MGTYSTNHQEHFIEFHSFGKTHKLYGFQPPPTQLVTSDQTEKLLQKGALAYILQCQEMELLTCEGDMDKQTKIKDPIKKHHKVFQELPMELPPNRKIEHIIEIEPGTKPASSKPYRYLHHHKIEIERLT